MKYTKHIMIAASVALLLVAVTWFMRDAIIQRLSNPLLEEYGVAITDVSFDALSTSDATISYLELVHENGTSITIEGLTLPIRKSSTGLKTYSADKIAIISATRTEGDPFELARLIDQFLSLPDSLGDTEFFVTELSVPPYPMLHALQLVLLKGEQRLSATIDSVPMLVVIAPVDVASRNVVFSLPGESTDTVGRSISANMRHSKQGISLSGLSPLDLLAWEPLAKLARIVPQEITMRSGNTEMQFDVEIPYDASRSASLDAELTPSSPMLFAYSDKSGEIVSIKVESGSSVHATATFPNVEWSLRQEQASLIVTYDKWTDIPLSIADLSCKTGPSCSMNTSVSLVARALPFGEVGHVVLSSVESIVFLDDGPRIDVQTGATVEVTGISVSDIEVKRIAARLVSSATLEFVDSGWRLAADSVDGKIEGLSLSENVAITLPLFLENVSISELNQVLSADFGVYAPESVASIEQGVVKLPGFKGSVSREGDSVAVDLQTVGLHQDGTVSVEHNLNTSAGHLVASGVGVSFGAQRISNRVLPWRYQWDVTAGTVLMDFQATWTPSDSGLKFDGQTLLGMEDLAGHYTDTAFAGLSTTLETAYSTATGFLAKPSTITVELIEMGLPVENISASYSLYPDEIAIDVTDLQMTAFGGVMRADPFSFHTAADANTVIMRAEAIQLSELLTLEEFPTIKVSGTVGAELPMIIAGDSLTIAKGHLLGEPPGGTIRYTPESMTDETDSSSIGFVTRALSNFEYETLTSEIDYNADGDLNLQLRLTGRSPALDENRPVVLNLGVENNVPQMLKSLRAARSVEEILEKRLQE